MSPVCGRADVRIGISRLGLDGRDRHTDMGEFVGLWWSEVRAWIENRGEGGGVGSLSAVRAGWRFDTNENVKAYGR
jgi:hypothetical protein